MGLFGPVQPKLKKKAIHEYRHDSYADRIITLVNRQALNVWKKEIETAHHSADVDYSVSCLRFAHDLAELIESAVNERGARFDFTQSADIADAQAMARNRDNISGLQFQMAVKLLKSTWIHGSRLAKWA